MELFKTRLDRHLELSLSEDQGWLLREVTLDRDFYYGNHVDIKWIIDKLRKIYERDLDDSISGDIEMIYILVDNNDDFDSMIDSIREVMRDFKSKLNIDLNTVSNKNDLLVYLIGQEYQTDIERDQANYKKLLNHILSKLDLTEDDYHKSYTKNLLLNQFNLIYYNFNGYDNFGDLIQVTRFYDILKIASKLGLIPSEGKADTLLGELFRACQRVVYRLVNGLETSFSYKDNNFMDACNLCDALTYIRLSDSTKNELCKYIIESINKYTDSSYKYDPNSKFKLMDYIKYPWVAAIILNEALYHYMIDHLIDASDEVISALTVKNPEFIKQDDVKFKDNELTKPGNELDFRSNLYYIY